MRLHGLTALAAALVLAASVAAQETARCPVAGREFTVTDRTKTVLVNGQKLAFCCANCPNAFAADPEKFVKTAGNCPINKNGAAKIGKETRVALNNNLYYFCCANCMKAFKADPSRAVKELKDPVTGKTFAPTAASPRAEVNGQIYLFADAESKAAFEKEPTKFVVAYK